MDYVIGLLDNDEEVNGLFLACHDELEMWTKTNITVAVRRVLCLNLKRSF
jgi:hypothetical protein